MTEDGPSTSTHRASTGEFTDDLNSDIPLQDIREAEFSRLETLEAPPSKSTNQQNAWWRRWLPFKRSRGSSGGYAKVEEEDGVIPETGIPKEKDAKSGRKRSGWTCGGKLGWTIFIFLAISNLFLLLASSFTDRVPNPLSRWRAPNTGTEGLSWYPTDFLRDVLPIPAHSHNDYWREIPLFSALYAGCISVEADVWLFSDSDDLWIGHNSASLTKNRTFTSLYIDPLVKILSDKNPDTQFNNGSTGINGVFDTDPTQSLTLLIDIKTDSLSTWPAVQSQLQPLRDRGWLTFVENDTLHPRPITVVGTGNARFDVLTSNSTYRDAFFDAPLERMYEAANLISLSLLFPRSSATPSGQGAEGTSPSDEYGPLNSYYASVSFEKSVGRVWWFSLSDAQKELIRGQIRGAKRRGLKARYWDTPAWPKRLRNDVWKFLWEEGVGVLNVDDLDGVRGLW